MKQEQSYSVLELAFNGAAAEDHGDHVIVPAKIAAEGIYEVTPTPEQAAAGVKMARGYRNPEETRKMIHYCNGLRLVERHPPGPGEKFIGANFKDKQFPVFGVTMNAREARTKGPKGEVRIEADVRIDKQDRAGNNREAMINGIRAGEIPGVSIGTSGRGVEGAEVRLLGD